MTRKTNLIEGGTKKNRKIELWDFSGGGQRKTAGKTKEVT